MDYTLFPESNDDTCCLPETIHVACIVGDIEMVKRMLRHSESCVDDFDGCGASPIIYAAMHGRLEVARWLAKHGANVTVALPNGMNILHIAAYHGQLNRNVMARSGTYCVYSGESVLE